MSAVEWSALAVEDRERIFDYIEQDDPRAAVRIDQCIADQAELLTRFPEGGRPGRVEGTREWVVRRTHYVMAYRVVGTTVRILRVLHSAQQWPEDFTDQSSNAR